MSKYYLYSTPEINKASLIIRDKIMNALGEKNYSFVTDYNDLYFLKAGKTVRRLKGWFRSEVNTTVLMNLKDIVKSCSNDEFECDINPIRKDCGYDPKPGIYIIKITNK